MPAKDLGVKHVCWKCGTRFYDLKKPEPVCPKCGSDPRKAPQNKPPPALERRRVAAKEPAVDEVPEPVEDAEIEEEIDEPEEVVDEET